MKVPFADGFSKITQRTYSAPHHHRIFYSQPANHKGRSGDGAPFTQEEAGNLNFLLLLLVLLLLLLLLLPLFLSLLLVLLLLLPITNY